MFWVLLCQNSKIHDRVISQVFHTGQPLLHEKINLLLNLIYINLCFLHIQTNLEDKIVTLKMNLH